ncbi:MAG TPA: chemotaxis protein CheB [Polyangia bacterium]|nr:chemotaxis protein CheB [Polyangia bacterium]
MIGASAGGVDALSRLVAELPGDLPAAVFIVIHTGPLHSTLPEILSARGPLHAAHALHGELIVPGRIYVAPPDVHLSVQRGYVDVTRGPKENGYRPSIDVLFRTASKAYGPRVVGVVLTGYLDCGTAGLLSVKARGGLAVVQDPREAVAAGMPESAIQHVAVDHVVSLADLPPLLQRLVADAHAPEPKHLPGALTELEGDEVGAACELVCPDCNGKLTVTEINGFQRFRCHVGHAYSLPAVAAAQDEHVEHAIWAAVRALEESAKLAQRLAATSSRNLRRRFEERAESQEAQARLIRNALLDETMLMGPPGQARGGADQGWSLKPSDPPSIQAAQGGSTMAEQKHWKGDAVADAPSGESEASADRVAGREASVHPRESPPPNPGRFQPRRLTPEDDREIDAEKREEAIERHAEDRQTGNGTAPKNM